MVIEPGPPPNIAEMVRREARYREGLRKLEEAADMLAAIARAYGEHEEAEKRRGEEIDAEILDDHQKEQEIIEWWRKKMLDSSPTCAQPCEDLEDDDE